MNKTEPVVIALERHARYEDVHPDLVIEDAIHPGWTYEFVRDEGSAVIVAIDRPEGYERVSRLSLAKEAVRTDWPSWSVIKR